MEKLKLGALGAVLAIATLVGAALFAPAAPVHAQTIDTWSGHDERIACVDAVTITSTTQLIAATTGKKVIIKAIDLSSSIAGAVKLQDGSGGTTIGEFYLAANTPRQIPEGQLGTACKTTSGNALFAIGPSTAALTATIRYQLQ
jgi:hypothetical protein